MEGLFCCTLGPGKRWELPGGGNEEFLRIILNFSRAASSGPPPQLCLPLQVKPKPRQLHKVEENSIFLTSRSPQSRSFPAGSGGLGMPSWRWKSHSRSFWRVQGLVPGSLLLPLPLQSECARCRPGFGSSVPGKGREQTSTALLWGHWLFF